MTLNCLIVAMVALPAWAQDDTVARRIVVSLSDRKLALVEGDRLIRLYDVAVGKASTPSPEGTYQVVTRVTNPTWYGPNEVVPAGSRNPLGPRWLGLSTKGYGIHGTNAPRTIGRAASKGCIRMRNRDVEELFDLVQIGDTVELLHTRPEWLNAVLIETPQSGPEAVAKSALRTGD